WGRVRRAAHSAPAGMPAAAHTPVSASSSRKATPDLATLSSWQRTEGNIAAPLAAAYPARADRRVSMLGDDAGNDCSITAELTSNDIGDVLELEADVSETGRLSAHPKVVRKTGLLLAASPMIDAGTGEATPKTDIEGDPRPNPAGTDPGKCDIGADEF